MPAVERAVSSAAVYRPARIQLSHDSLASKHSLIVQYGPRWNNWGEELSVSHTTCVRNKSKQRPTSAVVLSVETVQPSSLKHCVCYDLHSTLVPYSTAWGWQKALVSQRHLARSKGEEIADAVVIVQHPPVYTLGTRSSLDNLKFDKDNPPFELHITERGGEVTYHGPGQVSSHSKIMIDSSRSHEQIHHARNPGGS